jgi:hypothetical protein
MSDYLCNSRVCCRVRVTRRVEFTLRVRVWNYFPTRVHLQVTRRVKFSPNRYGWALPIGYVPIAIFSNGIHVDRTWHGQGRMHEKTDEMKGEPTSERYSTGPSGNPASDTAAAAVFETGGPVNQ